MLSDNVLLHRGVDFAGLDNGNNAKRKAATHGCEDGKCKVVVGFRHGRCGFLACGFYFIFDLSFLLRCEILLVELFVVHVFNVVGDCCYTSMCMSPLSAHAAFCSFTEHLYSVFLLDGHTLYKSLPPAYSFR